MRRTLLQVIAIAYVLGVLAPSWALADDYDNDYDDRYVDDYAYEDFLVQRIEMARSNPLLLDEEFFARLSETHPRSAPRYALAANLQYIDWYQVPVARDHIRVEYPQEYDRFVSDNMVTVAVVSPNNPFLAPIIAQNLEGTLPEYVRLVRKPKRADILLVVERIVFEKTADSRREPRSPTYKKKYRRNPDPSRQYISASFTRVKETIRIDYEYRITVQNGDFVLSQRNLQDQVHASFTYGENMTVMTAAGVRQGTPEFYPSKKSQRLMTTDVEAARKDADAKARESGLRRLIDAVATMDIPYRRHLRYAGRHRH